MIKACNRVIEYSFYSIFLLVPWAFTSKTSELFEMNKMWLVWALTIIIVTAWLIKMVLYKRFIFQRTLLDLPILLFLLSQVVSTIFSLDPHTSLWGYYSRFNGGLLSIVSYILLYYAFLSNLPEGWRARGTPVEHPQGAKRLRMSDGGEARQDPEKFVKRILFLSLISGLIVALWGLPSHFGYDPTCLLFRGTFDVSCWTDQFMPTVRIFSTLGQPDWLAAYLAILIPIGIAFAIKAISDKKEAISKNSGGLFAFHLLLIALFYVDLLYTRARSGFLGIWFALIFFFATCIFIERKKINFSFLTSHFSFLIGLLLLITFVIGTPINQLRTFTLEGIGSYFQKPATPATTEALKKTETQKGGTESGDIRLNVWRGAISAWKANPIFGSGVETFAFAYYKYKPAEHNLTSEWDYLYNKAHNEYLNYLATTGVFGLGTYLFMIGWFIIKVINDFRFKIKDLRNKKNSLILNHPSLIIALVASYISILITNFFGFSVVITNIYLFMIPAFVFVLTGLVNNPQTSQTNKAQKINPDASIWQWTSISLLLATSCFLLIALFRFWSADIAYALGSNLDRAGEYESAYPHLHKAVRLRESELVFKDKLSVNNAYIAVRLLIQEPPADQKEQVISVATNLIQEAIATSNETVSKSPNNAVFWKTRTLLFHKLSQVDSKYLTRALDAIEKASLLAPNDARIWYNLGVIYGQNNNLEKGIEALETTVKLKPDYKDARYGLGLFYHQASMDEKAIAQMQYILDNINPEDKEALESITSWEK